MAVGYVVIVSIKQIIDTDIPANFFCRYLFVLNMQCCIKDYVAINDRKTVIIKVVAVKALACVVSINRQVSGWFDLPVSP